MGQLDQQELQFQAQLKKGGKKAQEERDRKLKATFEEVKRKGVKPLKPLVCCGGFKAFQGQFGPWGKYNVTKNEESGYIRLDPLEENLPHQYCMIFLHGMGDSADGFLTIFESNEFNLSNNCRIILPTAPTAPVTANDGEKMTSWFDIITLDPGKMRTLQDTRKCFN